MKKLTTAKTSGEKVSKKSLLLTMGQFFFEIRSYAMELGHHKKMNKKGFLK